MTFSGFLIIVFRLCRKKEKEKFLGAEKKRSIKAENLILAEGKVNTNKFSVYFPFSMDAASLYSLSVRDETGYESNQAAKRRCQNCF